MIKNCYIHIPFCNKICSYCDFCKLYYDEKFVNRYLNDVNEQSFAKNMDLSVSNSNSNSLVGKFLNLLA